MTDQYTDCRFCSLHKVHEFIDFGELPLGNAFPKPEDFATEKLFPLKLGFCENCYLVQQTEPPPVEALQKDYTNYSYVPYGTTLATHYSEMAESIAKDLSLGPRSLVVDIGSNDGLLLGKIRDATGCRTLGIEPAVNISEIARLKGIPTLTGFFTHELSDQIIRDYQKAAVVTVTQVLQHIPNLDQFLGDIYRLLGDKGTLVIEGRYFTDTLEKTSYDTVYHEMMWFFTLLSLKNVLKKHGFTIVKAQLTKIYGGSLRIYAKKGETRRKELSVASLLIYEKRTGLGSYAKYLDFADKTFELRSELAVLITSLKKKGKTIAAYGAPSTSATLLNFCGIGADQISYVVDDSPLKQNLHTPGTHIPITNSMALHANPPDYLLLLAWRLREEILLKVKAVRDKGTKVIIPLPVVEVI